ncbi:MAG: pentapeptide repeat-containing protein [Vicinamibacterales bacterium]
MSRMLSQRNVIGAVLALLGSLVVLIALRSLSGLSEYPVHQSAALRRQLAEVRDLPFDKRIQLETALLQYETDNRIKIWTAIVQAAGGAALLIGLLFTARNLRATQDKLDIDRQGQLTNRFIQATGQLGAELKGGQPNIEVRLGGIYALNRIAKDWPKDYWPIADVLTAYVRHNARWSPSSASAHEPAPTTDIQAILTILGRNDPPGGFNERQKLDLRHTDLRGAEFWDARLEWTDFWGAHLEGAKLWGAVLRHAKLDNARLSGANLRAAKLEQASLEGADVTGAIFDRNTVWPAGFDARRRGAVFIEESA